jgi:two-component system cell cycle response regulator DivK
VLLIEDNEQNRYLLTFLLEQSGYRVLAATDGLAGIEQARALTPAPTVILVDIQLPRMDGYAVAQVLRAEAALRATPIVAVTSYAMPGDRERALSSGCTGYIEKPINPNTFVSEMRQVIDDYAKETR